MIINYNNIIKNVIKSELKLISIYYLISNYISLIIYSQLLSSIIIINIYISSLYIIYNSIYLIRICKYPYINILNNYIIKIDNLYLESILNILILSIELISHISRILSLSIRITLNILCGHLLLKICISILILLYNSYIYIYTIPLISIIICILILEFFICLLQSYIYSVLLNIYFNI